MMRRTIPLIATLAAILFATPAGANTTDAIARDCQRSTTGSLTGTYTKAQLRKALNNLPSDVSEYSDCYDQISQALHDVTAGGSGGNGSTGGGTGSGGSGGIGSTGGGASSGGDGGTPAQPATPHTGRKDPVEIGGAVVQPGTIPAIGQDAHTLPTPLLVFLVLLGLGATALAATTIVRRVLARRRA